MHCGPSQPMGYKEQIGKQGLSIRSGIETRNPGFLRHHPPNHIHIPATTSAIDSRECWQAPKEAMTGLLLIMRKVASPANTDMSQRKTHRVLLNRRVPKKPEGGVSEQSKLYPCPGDTMAGFLTSRHCGESCFWFSFLPSNQH